MTSSENREAAFGAMLPYQLERRWEDLPPAHIFSIA
jgi:hypothetical protein